MTRKIYLLTPPNVQLLDAIGPLDVFAEANRRLKNPHAYDLKIVGFDSNPIVGTSGVRLLPDVTIKEKIKPIDTLMVAGSPTIRAVAGLEQVQKWIRKQSRHSRRTTSVCSGAFILAEANLLDGLKATTHWSLTKELRKKHPDIQVNPDAIYIKDGDVYTSAGVSAGIDLALALVEEDHGRKIALKVARQLVVFLKRPGGQSQFSAHLVAQHTEHAAIRDLQKWVLENLSKNLTITKLANEAGMSPRNFARIFRKETHSTPAEFVELARVDAAKRKLEETDSPIKAIASDYGFGSVHNLRRSFIRKLGVTPNAYRNRFHS